MREFDIGRETADLRKIKFFEISTITKYNIDRLFESLYLEMAISRLNL